MNPDDRLLWMLLAGFAAGYFVFLYVGSELLLRATGAKP